MPNSGKPSPLVPLKQIPRVHLVRHVRELVAPAVGDDHVAAGLEGLQVVGHLGAEELRRVQRGLVDHHGHALGLHALHDALDGARAEVVGVGLLRQAMRGYFHLISYSSKEGFVGIKLPICREGILKNRD